MDLKAYLSEKLSKMLFLEMKKDKVLKIFKVNLKENIYIPVKAKNIADKVKNGDDLKEIPVGYFVEGMFYVLGADESFKFNHEYESLLNNIPKSEEYIKGKIFEYIKDKNFEDSYVLLKGLSKIDGSEDIYNKLILILEKLRCLDKMYKVEEKEIIQKAKTIHNFANPHLYDALIKKEDNDLEGALNSLKTYVNLKGKVTDEILSIKENLEDAVGLNNAKHIINEKPEQALKILIPLMKKFEENTTIYYYVAVAYRNLKNHDKAIYYLNMALEIDNTLIDVINELAINYASLGDYDLAIKYLRKVLEVEQNIEICTNLIMCYLNKGDLKQAQSHLEIGKKIDPKDEVLIEIEEFMMKNIKK